MAEFHFTKGYDIRLAGDAPAIWREGSSPTLAAIQPPDFPGFKPKLEVKVGDAVKRGQPLLFDKHQVDLKMTAPIAGTVKDIIRGDRRAIMAVVVEADGSDGAISWDPIATASLPNQSRESVMERLLASGLFGCFRQRPFNKLASVDIVPRDIFISGINSGPLAPCLKMILDGEEEAFAAGLEVLKRLTTGKVHLGLPGNSRDLAPALAAVDVPEVEKHYFSGPHPVGNVGVQIHHVKPIANRTDVVWTIKPHQVVWIGKLFLLGTLDLSQVVAVTGSAADEAVLGYYRTTLGAQVADYIGTPVPGTKRRVISGDALTGRKVDADGFLGIHDTMVTLLPEVVEPEFIGWMLPGVEKESFWGTFLSYWFGTEKKFIKDTALNGGHRALILGHRYEEVMPMDVLPIPLLKSIMCQDIAEMEGLGIYEIAEEDFALCEYICPSKVSMQKKVREGLDLVCYEG